MDAGVGCIYFSLETWHSRPGCVEGMLLSEYNLDKECRTRGSRLSITKFPITKSL
jgi:hypothetical protein